MHVRTCLCACEREAGAGMRESVITKTLFSSHVLANSNAQKQMAQVTKQAQHSCNMHQVKAN